MRKHIILMLLIAAPSVAACSVQDRTVSAYTSDEPAPAALDGTCKSVADTGDMYRYCLEYGPQQAMAR
jgi:hypothetical protein